MSNPVLPGRAIVAALTVLFPAAGALAADADGDADARDVVVSATRTPTDVAEVALPVIVINRQQIEQALAGDVAALLAAQPGLEVARTGGPGQAASLFVRGSASNHSIVLVDGVRVNPGTIGGAALQNIQPESLERIEVVEGARSSLYGSDAIGGVVNLVTRAGAARGVSAMASVGRYGARTLAIDGGGDVGGVQLGASLARQQADGFPPAAGSSSRGDYDNTSGNVHASWAASESLVAEATGWRASGRSAYDDFGFPAAQDFTDASYGAALRYGREGDAQARVAVDRAQSEYRQLASPDFDRTVRDALEAQLTVPHGAHRLAAGLQASDEHTDSLTFGLPYDVRTRAWFGWAQDQWHGERNDVLLAAGATRHDDFGSHATGNAEWVGRIATVAAGTLRASAAWGSAFHAPDATSRFGWGGNPALGPETSHQLAAGLRWERRGLQLRADGWENRLAGLVQYVPVDPVNFVYQARNIASARVRGVSLEGDWRAAAWRVRAWGELQDARDLGDGSALLRRAREQLGSSVQWQHERVQASLDALYAGPRPDFGGARLGGYALLSLGGRWQATRSLELQARLENLFDRHYELASGYNVPGRSLTLALRYRPLAGH